MTLHLVRPTGSAPRRRPPAVEAGDWLAFRDATGAWTLEPDGAPPVAPGPIDHAALARLVLAADRVITW